MYLISDGLQDEVEVGVEARGILAQTFSKGHSSIQGDWCQPQGDPGYMESENLGACDCRVVGDSGTRRQFFR
jgi:hypothetical protein